LGGSWSSTRLVGTVKAREHYFIGDIIDGAAAAALGLVNRVVEDEALCGETAALDHDRWQIGSSLSVKICV
jgi:2-(1,2-epoxy-1,2-dihydrophenyl)acetyl-CoA isomerase